MCVPVTSEDLFADDRAVKPGHDSVDGLLCTLIVKVCIAFYVAVDDFKFIKNFGLLNPRTFITLLFRVIKLNVHCSNTR